MKQTLPTILALALSLGLLPATGSAQTSEVSASLLSQISRQSAGGDFNFTVSFGSLNGGLASLLTKDSSANGAAGFATWYAANSRTFLTWDAPVLGLAVDPDLNAYYRYYGPDTSVETRAGDALASIYDPTKDNRALAFVTYTGGSGVEEIGLYDFGFNWGDPNDGGSFPSGLYDILS